MAEPLDGLAPGPTGTAGVTRLIARSGGDDDAIAPRGRLCGADFSFKHLVCKDDAFHAPLRGPGLREADERFRGADRS